MTPNGADHALTPSEVVFLQASRFVDKAGTFDKYAVVDSGVEVSKKKLAVQAVAAALLANDEGGAIRLKPASKKALLGLRTVQTLYAEPADATVPWPDHSLEARVAALVRRMNSAKGPAEVANVVYAMLADDEYDPSATYADLVRNGLAARGLLEKIEEKKLKIITVHHYHLPEATSALAAAQVGGVQELLGGCQSGRSDVWELLQAQVQSGIQRRKKQVESSDD